MSGSVTVGRSLSEFDNVHPFEAPIADADMRHALTAQELAVPDAEVTTVVVARDVRDTKVGTGLPSKLDGTLAEVVMPVRGYDGEIFRHGLSRVLYGGDGLSGGLGSDPVESLPIASGALARLGPAHVRQFLGRLHQTFPLCLGQLHFTKISN